MLEILNYAYLVALFICAILSLKTFRLRWPLPYKIFCIVLWVELLTEIIAEGYFRYQYYYLKNANVNNHWIISIGIMFQILLYGLTYYTISQSRHIKQYTGIAIIAFIGFALYNFLGWQGFFHINSYTHLAGSVLTIGCIFLYFEEVRNQKELKSIIKIPIAWISLALFAYHLLNIPYIISFDYLNSHYPSIASSSMYVYKLVILIANLLILKAFLCPNPQPK